MKTVPKIITCLPPSGISSSRRNHPKSTEIEITIIYEKSADLERILNMGFKEGFTAGLDNLDSFLAENREEA